MSDVAWSKLGVLAATVVLLVVAFSGGFATYAAFTDSETATVTFSTGTITGSGNVAEIAGAAGNAGCQPGVANAGDGGAGNTTDDSCSTGYQVVTQSIGVVATPATRP